MPQHFARCHHVTVSQHGSVWNDILAMGHGKKAKPFFKRCLINLVLLCFAYFCNPNLGTGNCLWLLPWPVLWLGWLLATLSFHPSWVVFSCCCEQRTCDPQGRNWLAADQRPLAAKFTLRIFPSWPLLLLVSSNTQQEPFSMHLPLVGWLLRAA